MNFQQMHTQRKVALTGALAGVIAGFLPWYRVYMGSVSGMNGIGVLVFLLFIATGIMSLAGDHKTNMPSRLWLLTIAAGFINLVIIGYMIIRFESATSGMNAEGNHVFNSVYGGGFGLGIGIWLALAAGITVAGGAYIFRSASDDIKASFHSLKDDMQKTMTEAGKKDGV